VGLVNLHGRLLLNTALSGGESRFLSPAYHFPAKFRGVVEVKVFYLSGLGQKLKIR